MGYTTQARELERYLSGVETKYQSKGESLYGDVSTPDVELHKPTLSSQDILEQLAGIEAGQEKYAKSWEGQQFVKDYIKYVDPSATEEDVYASKSWMYKFGMPSLVAMPTYPSEYGDPSKNIFSDYAKGEQMFNPATTSTGDYIYTGLGKSLLDQFEGSVAGKQLFEGDVGAYQQAKDTYWDDRTAAESAGQQFQPSWGGGGGDQGGAGYYGDPRRGNPIEQMAGFYTPQANLQQAMINVHNVPTGFQMKRGGIVSLLRLN